MMVLQDAFDKNVTNVAMYYPVPIYWSIVKLYEKGKNLWKVFWGREVNMIQIKLQLMEVIVRKVSTRDKKLNIDILNSSIQKNLS